MSPFRLFGRPPEPEPALEPDDGGVIWAPGAWDREPGPATRHARPVAFGRDPELADGAGAGLEGRAGHWPGEDDDPPTDPYGFPPIPIDPAATWAPPRAAGPTAHGPDPAEAAALAGAFAADYLSWDEDEPGRRGQALADHLAAPVGDPALLGWNGRGRQRAELALPGLVRADGDGRVLVDVRVRVTPYREVGDRTADRAAEAAEPEPDVLGVPAAAPAPTGRGWRGCASYWVRLSVPVVREDARLVVDAAEEVELDPADDLPDTGADGPRERRDDRAGGGTEDGWPGWRTDRTGSGTGDRDHDRPGDPSGDGTDEATDTPGDALSRPVRPLRASALDPGPAAALRPAPDPGSAW